MTPDRWKIIARLVAWLDANNGTGEQERQLRVLKLTEEAGEVAQAVIGTLGQNPRKGITHTPSDVADELCDVIVTAMVALHNWTDDPAATLDRKLTACAARTTSAEADSGIDPVSTRQTVCHLAVCVVCGYAYDEDGDYGAYHYSSPEAAVRGATSEDPEYAFTQLPDGNLLCRRSDRAHQEVLGTVLASEAETRLHEQLAADGQQRVPAVTN